MRDPAEGQVRADADDDASGDERGRDESAGTPPQHARQPPFASARAGLASVSWRATLPLALSITLGLGLLITIQLVARPLAFLVIAVAIAEALAPVVDRLQRRVPRALAIGIVFGVLVAGVALTGWLVFPAVITQGRELLVRAPELVGRVQTWVAEWDARTGLGLAGMLAPLPARLGQFLVELPLRVFGAVVDLLLIMFLAAYWLIGARSLERFTLSLVPVHRRERLEHVLHRVGQSMGGYVRGAAINAVIMGVLAWVGLALIGVDYALVLGVLTMLGEPIPIIGPIIVAVPVVLVALLQSPAKAALALALFTVLQQVEGQLLTPNIMRRQTDVPQTLVIFAVVAGAAIGGLLGVLASIPLVAALRVLTLEVVVPAVRRWTGAPAG